MKNSLSKPDQKKMGPRCRRMAMATMLAACLSLAAPVKAQDKPVAAKCVRLHVIAFGLKNNPEGLRQLKAVAEAAHGRFDTADTFQQLEHAFVQVSKPSVSEPVVVRWPEPKSGGRAPAGTGIEPRSPPGSLLVEILGAALILLVLITGVTAWFLLQPSCLVDVREPGRQPRQALLRGVSLWIGRDGSCDVSLADPRVSRYHLVVHPARNGFRFRDNHSRNGVYVDGHRIEEGFLPYGKALTLGDTVVRIGRRIRLP